MSGLAGRLLDDARSPARLALLAAGVALAAVLPLLLLDAVGHDEVEHLGVAWRVATGEVPYRDFHQNHLPLLWYGLAPLVAAFQGTMTPLYLGRLGSLAATAAAGWLGWRLLRRLGGEGALERALYVFFLVMLLPVLQLHRVRPDPPMAALTTGAFFLLAGRSGLSRGAALLSGLLLGLAASFSTKMFLLCLAFPAALLVLHAGLPARRRLEALGLHVLGFVLGVTPLALFLARKGLWEGFRVNVWDTNRLLDRSGGDALAVVLREPFTWCLLAAVALLAALPSAPRERRPLLFHAPLFALAGFATLALATNSSPYNLAPAAVPLALCLTAGASLLLRRVGPPRARLAVVAAGVGLFAAPLVPELVPGPPPPHRIARADLARLVREHGGGAERCIGMAPYHPIYCRNVSPVQLGWDLHFLRLLRSTPAGERYRGFWAAAMREALGGEADLIVRRWGQVDPWRGAGRLGAYGRGELRRFRQLRRRYRSERAGSAVLWVRGRTPPGS